MKAEFADVGTGKLPEVEEIEVGRCRVGFKSRSLRACVLALALASLFEDSVIMTGGDDSVRFASSSFGRPFASMSGKIDPAIASFEWLSGVLRVEKLERLRFSFNEEMSSSLLVRFAFSLRSALKKTSRGEGSRTWCSFLGCKVGESPAMLLDDSPDASSVAVVLMSVTHVSTASMSVALFKEGSDLEKNFGMGNDDGAGEA